MDISDNGSDVDSDAGEKRIEYRSIVRRVVDALGGFENGEYRLGDEATGCVKDLKKLWKMDEDNANARIMAKLFWESLVLPNDLIPIILVTAGKGHVEDKRAISCVDLITAMTWPIEMSEELQEINEEIDPRTDYSHLIQSHLHYKAALLEPGVLETIFRLIVPPLTKASKQRTERDGQIVNVVLHLVRNLAFIKDVSSSLLLSADTARLSGMQSELIKILSETRMIELFLTIASNSTDDAFLNQWNTLILEILYLLFRSLKPSSLSVDQKQHSSNKLRDLLIEEEKVKKQTSRQTSSRHSRFGTTIAIKLNKKKLRDPSPPPSSEEGASTSAKKFPDPLPKTFVMHRQQALTEGASDLWDIAKRHRAKKAIKADGLTLQDNLSVEARIILQQMATDFLDACFNPFLSGLLKDIRAQRPKIVEKDHIRLLFVTKWFLDFFLCMRAKALKEKPERDDPQWEFSMIAEVIERQWIVWVLKRMRTAVDDKPKLWAEFQAGVECLTQLLLLIDSMSSSDIEDPELNDAAEVLQQQLIYNGDILDITYESLRAYKRGIQSIAYLESSVNLAYILLRMLEKWSKGNGDMYVRKKKKRTMKNKEEVLDDEVEEAQQKVQEITFTFEIFEAKLANSEITSTLLQYLSGHQDFSSSESLKRVVTLLHRQAVRTKSYGLFFNVSTLNLFKTILDNRKSFPPDQPHKDLVALINHILRQFFKALEKNTYLAVEAFFPKHRGQYTPTGQKPEKQKKEKEKERTAKSEKVENNVIDEVKVKEGYSWSDQLGIVVAALVDDGKQGLVEWFSRHLGVIADQRKKIIEAIDASDDELEDDGEVTRKRDQGIASPEALAKIKDASIICEEEEQAHAISFNPQIKLLMLLCKCILDNDVTNASCELEWYIPASVLYQELERFSTVIRQFLETPIDLDGKKASQLLNKKKRRRRIKVIDSDAEDELDEEGPRRQKKEKQQKEKQQYKSAQFIEDSDEEYGGNLKAFLALEKERREKASNAAANVEGGTSKPSNMKATGTKKRRRAAKSDTKRKRRKGQRSESPASNPDLEDEDNNITSLSNSPIPESPPKVRPRPRPRPAKIASIRTGAEDGEVQDILDINVNVQSPRSMTLSTSGDDRERHGPKQKGRLIISDEDN